MGFKFKKRIKSIIQDDRTRKLKSFVASHNVDVRKATLGKDRTFLHYCALTGSPEMLQCIINLGCDPSKTDREGNLPVHTALQRANIQELRQARETLVDMVYPLLDAYPLGQDVENKDGMTAYEMLKALKAKLKPGSSDHVEKEKLMAEWIKEKEEFEWRQKLARESQNEWDDQLPRYDEEQDFKEEQTKETFEDWTERIRKERFSKHNHSFNAHSSDRRRRKKWKREDEPGGSKENQRNKDEEDLRKARQKMQQNYKSTPVAKTTCTEHLIVKKKRYEAKYSRLMLHSPVQPFTYATIPWPCADLNSVVDVLFCDLHDKKSSEYRKYLRNQQVRWHPDKFAQRFREHVHVSHLDKVMARVKAISQILNKLRADS